MSETSIRARDHFLDLCAAARSGGELVPARLAQAMGHYFGEDLTQVRVHRSASVGAFNARALAMGENVFFAPDAWRPDTRAGIGLLGHELAHVIQQRYLNRTTGGTGEGVSLMRCAGLEAQADRVGADLVDMLCDRMPTVRGAGRRVLGIPGVGGAVSPRSPAFVQLQEKGIVGGFVFGSPVDLAPTIRVGTVIFRQTASINEVHRTRASALDRVKLKHNIGGTAQRTYYSNAVHNIPPAHLGQGEKLRFMEDRNPNPVESYGRYYDFGLGKLIVEHTNDANCRMIEITAVNALNVTCQRWNMLHHFHMATYPTGDAFPGKYAVAIADHPDQIAGAPPGYEQAAPDGHHVYHLQGPAALGTVVVPRAEFNVAFAAGAQAVFTRVWFW